ncbi:MAG: hypothetical protein JWP34_5095 [Massilia sp.]|nr:hypothetical protein [Massilia sp.]
MPPPERAELATHEAVSGRLVRGRHCDLCGTRAPRPHSREKRPKLEDKAAEWMPVNLILTELLQYAQEPPS